MDSSLKEGFVFVSTCCNNDFSHIDGCEHKGSPLDFETYYSKFKAAYYEGGGGGGGLPSIYVPKDLETYIMLLERLCVDNDVEFFLALVSFFTSSRREEHNTSTAEKNVQRRNEILTMKERVCQMFSDRIDTLLEGTFNLWYNNYADYADYIDPIVLLEKIIGFRLAERLSNVLEEMLDDVNNKHVTIDIPSFSDLKGLIPNRIARILSNDPDDQNNAAKFADAVVVAAAHRGYVKVIDIMNGMIDTQSIVCREIEPYLSNPDAKFYDSYGRSLPIVKTISLEGKRKISKWEYMVSAIRKGQMRRVQFMLECFPFEDVDRLARDEISKTDIKIDEFGRPDYRYTDIYELLYHKKFETDLKNHSWDQADIFLQDYEKYFGKKAQHVTSCNTAFHWYLQDQDFEVFKYLARRGMVIEFSQIYCGFRETLELLAKKVDGQLRYDPSDPVPHEFAETLLPELNYYAKMLFHCFNPEVKLMAETKSGYVTVEEDVEEKDVEEKDEEKKDGDSSVSSDESPGQTKKVKMIRKIIKQPFCREPFEEARDLLWPLINPVNIGEEISLANIPSRRDAFDIKQNLMAIHRKYFRWD